MGIFLTCPSQSGRPLYGKVFSMAENGSKSSVGSNLMFVGVLVLAMAIFAIVMLAMGTRLDNQDPEPEPASAEETARQDAAVAISRIQYGATSLGPANEEALAAATDAVAWLEAVGGVWIPWPEGAPEGYTNPPLDLEPSEVSPEALAQDLMTLSTLMITNPPIDPDLATSIAASTRMHARAILGQDSEIQACPAVDFAILGGAAADGVSLERFETARQWLEVVAAESTPSERQNETDRFEDFTLLTEAIVDAGTTDTRPALAPRLPEAPLVEAYTLASEQLIFLSERATPEARDNIVNLMCHMAAYPDVADLEIINGPFPGLSEDQLTTPEPVATESGN